MIVCCLLPNVYLKKKKPIWCDGVSRTCSSEATERTGLSVIWHTVKDPRNLHSDCVPVGRAELCRSLAMLPLAHIPKLASALLRELEGGPVSEFTVAGCHLSPFSTYSSVYTGMFTHSAKRDLFHLHVLKGLIVRKEFNLPGISALKMQRGVHFYLDSLLTVGRCFNVRM